MLFSSILEIKAQSDHKNQSIKNQVFGLLEKIGVLRYDKSLRDGGVHFGNHGSGPYTLSWSLSSSIVYDEDSFYKRIFMYIKCVTLKPRFRTVHTDSTL